MKIGKEEKTAVGLLILFSVLLLYKNPAPSKQVNIESKQEIALTYQIPRQDTNVLLDAPQINQLDSPALYNGCEVTSLAMLLNFHGVGVEKNELAEKLETSPYRDSFGFYGNPNKAFVGDITGNTPGYFVYHQPIYELTKEYVTDELEVKDLTGKNFKHLKKQLSNGNPVWVITTTTFSDTNDNEVWQTRDGEVVISMSEHSVLLTGYDENSIFLNDPYGNKNYETDLENFIDSWEQLGSQAVTIVDKEKSRKC